MNSLIEWLNVLGGRFVDVALPILWQSSLLIALILAFDFLMRRKVRAAVRYSLWFVVFVKVLLPPTLALPTGAAWWLRSRPALAAVPHNRMLMVDYRESVPAYTPPKVPLAPVTPPAPQLSRAAWMLLLASAVSMLLAVWLLLRWRQITQCVRRTTKADVELAEMLAEARRLAGMPREITLRVTAEAMSPAVCGLFRPVILLPRSLIEKLTPAQLRAVLLHELIHLRRRDVWVNCAQTLLQIVYWWHPLLWIANARVRGVREEAVDDAVMSALSAEAEVYAPTLLEVAKLAFARPLASLGLVGILESRSALRHRIERLLNSTTPRRAGVSVMSVICLAAFTALAVPMGEPPARPSQTAANELTGEKLIQYNAKVDPEVFVRNIQARANQTMHTTNDDLNDILASIMDGFGVDCTGERALQFDPATGVLAAKNTSEALRVLDEVVKELNLNGGEHVLNPPHGLKQVLIEGWFYLATPEAVAKLPLATESAHRDGELSPWWEVSPPELAPIQQQLRDVGVMQAGRIQTSHGSPAGLYIGDGTNDVRFDCVPYVHDGVVNFTVLARTTGKYAPAGKSWPDIAGHTNCAIFSRITVPNGGAAILRAQQAGSDRDLIILLSAKIVEPVVKTNVPVLGDLPGVGPFFRPPKDAQPPPISDLYIHTFRMESEALTKRLAKFAEKHNLSGVTNKPALLVDFLADAGVTTYPSRSFLFREENGRAELTLHATKEDLRKTAEALGLDSATGARTMAESSEGGQLFRTPTNASTSDSTNLYTYTFRLDPEKLNARLTKFVEENNLKGIPTFTLLSMYLDSTGTHLDPVSYHGASGRADVTFHATKEDLRKTAEALGLNWGVEEALHDGKRTESEPSREASSARPAVPSDAIHYVVIANTNAADPATMRSIRELNELLQEGKLLYRTGKLDEAGSKLQEALKIAPTNQAVLYYFNLVKQTQSKAAGYERYKTNLTVVEPSTGVAQLVKDGKLLYQLGRSDEAALKLEEALEQDPNNQAALYYLNLIKQTRARNLAPPAGGQGKNVPGPGTRPDDVTSMVRRVQNEQGPENNAARLNLPVPTPHAHTNTIYTSPQRQKIYEKLNSIVFDKIAFPNLPLSEVIRTLTEQTQRRDVDQEGINFILNKTKPPAGTTGQATPQTAEDVDLATVNISLDPGLRNVRLLDVLEAITKSAEHPISYAVVDYGIEFRLKGFEQVELHTRTFKVDPNTFYMGLQNVSTINFGARATGGMGASGGGGGSPGNGVPVPKVNVAPGNGGNTGGSGTSSRSEIQSAVIKFFSAVGVNLAPPKSVFFNDRQGTLTVHATDEDLELIEQAINTLNIAPPQVTMSVRTVELNDDDIFKPEFDWFLQMVAKNTKGAFTDITGILTETQFATLMKKIRQRNGADLLNETSVTTLSGRQAQLQLDSAEATNDIPSAFFPHVYATNSTFTLDLVPYVYADGYTIQLNLIPTISEPTGYANPADPAPAIQRGNGGIPIMGNLPLPRTRVRQVVINCTVWDGQTAMLLLKPYVAHQKNVVIFVTATIIDPSGNRKNSEGSLPFAQKAVPPQTAH